MIVNPRAFVMHMADRWCNSLQGTVTPALKQVWMQQAETFNAKIRGQYANTWIVLQPPTGSGKSRGLETYCSMLPMTNHPGVLIVVRMIEDASAMAEAINKLSGLNVAIAHHSEDKIMPEQLRACPVAVITHEAYKLALKRGQRDSYTTWSNGERKLIVIDEALNIIEQVQIDLDQLRILRAIIPTDMSNCVKECDYLDQIIATMHSMRTGKFRRINPEEWKLPKQLDLSKFIKMLKSIKFDELILSKSDEPERQILSRKYSEILNNLSHLVQKPCIYALKGKLHLFTRSQILIPKEHINAVVMDATASCNIIYELLGDRVVMLEPPRNVRSYKNVTFHGSIGHKAGKLSMAKKPEEDARNFMSTLAKELPKDKKVFICTHKVVEPHLIGYEPDMPEYVVTHWGAIDGKNHWNDCGTAVIYGLPYLDSITPEVTLQAIEEWHGKKFTPKNRDHLVHKLEINHQITFLIQAMNRVRCRNVIDKEGNCQETDIYVLLPDKNRSIQIVSAVNSAMPGMKYQRWQSSTLKRKIKRSKYEGALIAHLSHKVRGKHKAQDIRVELNIPETSFDRLIKKALDTSSDLYRELMGVGIQFRQHALGQGGRGHYSSFEKVA